MTEGDVILVCGFMLLIPVMCSVTVFTYVWSILTINKENKDERKQ
jgi:hypothetical protein